MAFAALIPFVMEIPEALEIVLMDTLMYVDGAVDMVMAEGFVESLAAVADGNALAAEELALARVGALNAVDDAGIPGALVGPAVGDTVAAHGGIENLALEISAPGSLVDSSVGVPRPGAPIYGADSLVMPTQADVVSGEAAELPADSLVMPSQADLLGAKSPENLPETYGSDSLVLPSGGISSAAAAAEAAEPAAAAPAVPEAQYFGGLDGTTDHPVLANARSKLKVLEKGPWNANELAQYRAKNQLVGASKAAPLDAAPVDAAAVDAGPAGPIEAGPVESGPPEGHMPHEPATLDTTPVDVAAVDAGSPAPIAAGPGEVGPANLNAAPVDVGPAESEYVAFGEDAPRAQATEEGSAVPDAAVGEEPAVPDAPVEEVEADIPGQPWGADTSAIEDLQPEIKQYNLPPKGWNKKVPWSNKHGFTFNEPDGFLSEVRFRRAMEASARTGEDVHDGPYIYSASRKQILYQQAEGAEPKKLMDVWQAKSNDWNYANKFDRSVFKTVDPAAATTPDMVELTPIRSSLNKRGEIVHWPVGSASWREMRAMQLPTADLWDNFFGREINEWVTTRNMHIGAYALAAALLPIPVIYRKDPKHPHKRRQTQLAYHGTTHSAVMWLNTRNLTDHDLDRMRTLAVMVPANTTVYAEHGLTAVPGQRVGHQVNHNGIGTGCLSFSVPGIDDVIEGCYVTIDPTTAETRTKDVFGDYLSGVYAENEELHQRLLSS